MTPDQYFQSPTQPINATLW